MTRFLVHSLIVLTTLTFSGFTVYSPVEAGTRKIRHNKTTSSWRSDVFKNLSDHGKFSFRDDAKFDRDHFVKKMLAKKFSDKDDKDEKRFDDKKDHAKKDDKKVERNKKDLKKDDRKDDTKDFEKDHAKKDDRKEFKKDNDKKADDKDRKDHDRDEDKKDHDEKDKIVVNNRQEVTVVQSNVAHFDTNISVKSNTGGNEIKGDDDVSLATGDVNTTITVNNLANLNVAHVTLTGGGFLSQTSHLLSSN